MDADEHRRASLESWQTMAAGWERRRAEIDSITAPVRELLVRELAPEPGQTILELAAGPGDTGFAAAAVLGPDGHLLTTDFSPEMIEVARRRADELGLRNVEFLVADAEHLDLADDSVDGVICRFGFMLMADPLAALTEARRVLRPDGRLVFAVWRGPERNPWVSIAGRVLVAHGLVPPPDPTAPGMFTMAADERVRELTESAGFDHVRLEDVPLTFVFSDVEAYVSNARDTGGMFATAYGQASDEEQEAVKRDLAESFAPFADEDGYELPGLALVAVAS